PTPYRGRTMPDANPEVPDRVPATDASLLRRLPPRAADAAPGRYAPPPPPRLRPPPPPAPPAAPQRGSPPATGAPLCPTSFRRAAVGEYEVPDGDELWKLFLVIGLNKIRAVAGYHKAAKRDVRQTAGGEAVETATPAVPDDIARRTLELTIDELLAPLPETHREIVRLRTDGFEGAEIATRVRPAKPSRERTVQE